MRLLITGGAGFIGSHCVEKFVAMGYDIVVFDNFTTGHNKYKHDRVQYITGDITSDADLAKLTGSFDYAIHLAAAVSVVESMTNPEKYYKTNIEGSKKVYETAIRLGVKKVVSASSAAVYGDCGCDKILETFKYGGISPYADSKYKMEQLVNQDGKLIGHETSPTVFLFCRFFNVYGPRQDPKSPYTGVMSIFMDRARDGRDLTIYGDGEQTRDFVFVEDLVCGVDTLLQKADKGVYNIGTEMQTTINDLARAIVKMAATGSKIVHEDQRAGDIKYSVSSSQKLQAFGWKAAYELASGVAKTWAWFVNGSGEPWEKQ